MSCLLQPVPEGLSLRLGFADPSAVVVLTLSLADESRRGLIKLQFTGPQSQGVPFSAWLGGTELGGAGLRTCLSSKFLGAADTAGSRIYRQFENYPSTVSYKMKTTELSREPFFAKGHPPARPFLSADVSLSFDLPHPFSVSPLARGPCQFPPI